MLLQLINVSKTYFLDGISVNALKGINFRVEKGQFLAIMGSSGSGKSTLMHIAGCLDTPTTGQVIFEGQDISKLSEEELARIRNNKIGFVFQSFNLIPRTIAKDNVALPLLYAGVKQSERNQRAESALSEVDLVQRINHFPNQLSGGEQQRVAIARALINRPSIIMADEPTGNLDTKTGNEIMKMFKKIHQAGNTIIMVTHELEIAKLAQKTIRIQDGRIV